MMALVLVMGIPGSGKTTFCKQLESLLGDDVLRISFDDIFSYCRITGEYGSFSMLGYHGLEAYNSYARTERKICESLIRNGLNTMKSEGKFCVPPFESILWNLSTSFVIVDDIFYLQSMRRPFERMARAHSLCYVVILMDTPLDVALQRNSGRPPQIFIPEETIRRLHTKLEEPSEDQVNFIRFGINDNVEDLVIKLKHMSSNYEPKVCIAKVPDSAAESANDNIWQKLESDLRKCIGDLVRENKSQGYARALGAAKKEAMAEFRSGGVKQWEKSDLKEMLQRKVAATSTNF